MRFRAALGASAGAAVYTRIHWIHHHHDRGRNYDQNRHQPLPTPPPLPPPPQQRRRNRCPCSECCVRRESNTPGECSFHAKAAVVVDAATTAITITDPPTIESTDPAPHRRRRNHYDYDKSGRRRSRGSVDAELLLLGEPKCYGSGRAEELPERVAAGVRVRSEHSRVLPTVIEDTATCHTGKIARQSARDISFCPKCCPNRESYLITRRR